VKLTVRPVNDPPTAVVAGSCTDGVTVVEDSGPYQDPSHCVENHNWGPVDEVTQYLSEWVVATDHPELFAAGPSISVAEHAFGELHFSPAKGAHGVASVSVRARDNGGTAHGGNDLSPVVSFDLTIKPTPEPTAEPTIAPDPSVDSTAPAEATLLPSETIGPTTGPDESPTSGAAGNGPVLLIGLLVAVLLVIGIAAPRVLRKTRGDT
jgi:Bacterial Ig domain